MSPVKMFLARIKLSDQYSFQELIRDQDVIPNAKHQLVNKFFQWPTCTIGSRDTAGGQDLRNRH